MPITISIKLKKIGNSATNNLVVEIYKAALKHKNMLNDNESKTEKDVTALNPRNLHDVPGLWAKIKRGVGTIVQTELDNTRQFVLPAIEVELDPPAKALRDYYLYYFNNLIFEELGNPIAATAKIIESESIIDHKILIREILIRLVTVALSDKLDQLEPDQAELEGNNITAIMKFFILELKKHVKKLFLNEGKISPLGRYLDGNQHAKSISNIDSIIWLLRELHAPRNTFTHCLNTLTKLERCIMGYLVAYFDRLLGNETPVTESELLEEDMLLNTISYCEDNLIGISNNAVVQVTNADFFAVASAEKTEKRTYLIQLLKSAKKDKTELKYNSVVVAQIEQLYDLLEKTGLMYQTISCFDTLITVGGWVPLLTNFIQAQSLATLFENFANQCHQVLRKCEQEKYSFTENISVALYSKFDTNGCLTALRLNIPKSIRALEDQGLIKLILNLTATNITELVRLQKVLKQSGLMEEKASLIDEKSQGVGLTTHSFQQPANSPHSPSSPLLQQGISASNNMHAFLPSAANNTLPSPGKDQRDQKHSGTTAFSSGQQATNNAEIDVNQLLHQHQKMVNDTLKNSGGSGSSGSAGNQANISFTKK